MSKQLIECEQLSVSFGAKPVLSNITMSVGAGEILSIIGPNGSGKTTLLRALIGAVPHTEGTINRSSELSIGYVPQKLHIDQTLPMTVERFMNLPKKHSKTSLREALEMAGVPNLGKQQLMDLSGGQFQRVLLARALLGKPNLLILDEATQGLDHAGVADFYRQIADVKDSLGCGILMISHELHIVMRQTDRVICLNGNICCQGRPEVITDMPEYRNLFGLDQNEALYLHKPHAHHDHHHTHDENCEGGHHHV